MNILQINNFYYKRGGSEAHFLGLIKLLESNGHNVIVFSTKNEKTLESKYSKYFPKYSDLSQKMNFIKKINRMFSFFINFKALKNLRKLIKENKIDIAHIHNIYHHLTPAILKILKKNNIKIAMTLHDYKVICPNYKLFNRGKTCEECKNKKYFNCYKNSCIENSRAKSLLGTLEMYFQRIFYPYSKLVDVFIAPSEFMKNELLKFDFENKNIEVLHNFVNINTENKEPETGDYFLYFGRLAKEKGLKEFIEILSEIKSGFKFLIAGSGPEETNLKNLVNNFGLESKIQFLGNFGDDRQDELKKLINNSKFIVIPNIWYENCSIAILETMTIGKAILASNLGGNAELVEDGNTGILFDISNKKETIDKINEILYNQELAINMGKNAKIKANNEFNKEIYYKKLIEIYQNLKP